MLTALSLTLVALLVLALMAAAAVGRALVAPVVYGGSLAGSLVLAGCGAFVLFGAPLAPESLPFGPPWGAMQLALDGLSAWFLLLLGLVGACSSLFAFSHFREAPARLHAAFPLFLAGMALTLVAADGFSLLLGFEVMSLASWVLVAAEHRSAENRRAARLYLTFAVLSACCLIPALGLLAGASGDLSFAALRARPPEGWRAAAVLALVLAGAGAKAGLVPLHVWLPLAHPAAPSHVSALMSAAMTKVALYVMARLLLDICGPAQPLWWGVPLLIAGAATAVLGALRANLEEDGKTLLACSTIENVGLIVVGLGLAACFRAVDLGPLAALAAAAALLHAMNHALFKTALFLGIGEVLHGAGAHRLDRLGGLIHAMPWTAALVLVAAAAAASLPPLSGFASEWLLLQALLAAWRLGDLAVQVLSVAVAAMVALAVALAAAAMVRMFGMVFLGRPRTPRAAGAVETSGAARLAVLIPVALTVLFGLLPGLMMDAAGQALRVLTRHDMAQRAGLSGIGVGDGAAAYAPLVVAVLLAVAGGAVVWAVRRQAPSGVARGPAWDCGFTAAPAHLPFGDPATQPSAAGLGQPLRRMLGQPMLGAHESVRMPEPGDPSPARIEAGFADPAFALVLRPLARARDAAAALTERLHDITIRQALMLPFATLVGLLALIAWLEGHG